MDGRPFSNGRDRARGCRRGGSYPGTRRVVDFVIRLVAWQRFHLGKMKDGAGYHGQRRLVMKMDIEVIESEELGGENQPDSERGCARIFDKP